MTGIEGRRRVAYELRRLQAVPHRSRNRPWEEHSGFDDPLTRRPKPFSDRRKPLQRLQRVGIRPVRILQSGIAKKSVPIINCSSVGHQKKELTAAGVTWIQLSTGRGVKEDGRREKAPGFGSCENRRKTTAWRWDRSAEEYNSGGRRTYSD